MKKLCITLRNQTEQVETVKSEWNTLGGTDKEKILTAFNDIKYDRDIPNYYGSSTTGGKILTILGR